MSELLRTPRLILLPYTASQLRHALDDNLEAPVHALGLTYPPIDNKERRLRRNIYKAKLQLLEQDPAAALLSTAWLLILPNAASGHPDTTPADAPAYLDGIVIGEMGFKGPPSLGKVEIGYGLSPLYHRQGFMTEAVAEMCRFAFTQTIRPVTCVLALTRWHNKASQGVLRKNGFTFRGLHSPFLLRWEKTEAAPSIIHPHP